MSITSAFNAGVSGLRGQGVKLATISDNIANSSTVGYKRRDVSFATLVLGGSQQNAYSAGGAIGQTRTEISREGSLVGSSATTDLAISGRGFFVVGDQADPQNGNNGFGLTRAGAFAPDAEGFLRNPSGQYLQGFALNPDGTFAAGAPSFDSFNDLETVNIANLGFNGDPTTEISFNANLPAQLPGTVPAPGPLVTSVEYFDELGASQRVTLEWQPGAVANEWTLSLYNGPDTASPLLASDAVTFNGGGPNAGTPAAFGAGLAVGADGNIALAVSPTQTVDLFLGPVNSFEGITQFVGDYTPTPTRNGSGAGELERIEIEEDGLLFAVFDNGARRPAFQIPVGDVTNPDGLNVDDGSVFRLSGDAGVFRMSAGGTGAAGTIVAGALENANVDIADELTQLIQTQRAYSSNATIIRTADEMLEEATRLGR